MSHDLDSLARLAVRDLADLARPADLAHAALREGRRRRRARTALTVTAVAVVAAAGAVPLLLRPEPSAPPQGAGSTTSPTTPTTSAPPTLPPLIGTPTVPPFTGEPALLPNGLIVGAMTVRSVGFSDDPGQEYYSAVWDRTRERYVEVPYPVVIPAPVGSLAVIVDPVTYDYGILDIASGRVRPLPALDGMFSVAEVPTWSPDGKSFAVIDYPKDGDFALAVVDAATGSVTRLRQDWLSSYCADFCVVGWYDHDTLVLPRGHNVSEALPPTYSGVQLFSAIDGTPEGALSLPGAFAGADDWSTDGRYVALLSKGWNRYDDETIVYDTQAGQPVLVPRHPLDVWWVSPTQFLQHVDGRLELVNVDARITQAYPLPTIDPSRMANGYLHVVLVQP